MAIGLLELERARRAGELMELAALSSEGLRSVFDEVAGLLDAEMIQMFNFTRPEAPDMIVAPSRAQIYEDYLAKGWHAHDTWSHRAAKVAKHGKILTDDSVTTPDLRKRDMFFQDFCPKWRIGNFTSWTFDLGGERWAFTLMGRPETENARPNEIVYRRFIEAADRAALLAAGRDSLVGKGIAEGLQLAGRPSLILDHTGRVAFASKSVEALVGQGFSIKGGRLISQQATVDVCFRQLTRHASSSLRAQLRNFLIPRGDGRRPILAMPVHVRDRGLHGLPGARIIIMFTDLDAASNVDAQMIGEVFDLTPREAELASRLLSGATLESAGQAMNVSVHTIRQLLKSVFAKTNTHRQAELIALLQRASPS